MTYLEHRVAEKLVVDVMVLLNIVLLLVGLFHRHGRANVGLSLDSVHYYDRLMIGVDYDCTKSAR